MTTPTFSTKHNTGLAGHDFLYILRSPKSWLFPLLSCILAGIGSVLMLWLPFQILDADTKAMVLKEFAYMLDISAYTGMFMPLSVYSAYPVFLFFGIIASFIAFDFCFSKTKANAFLSFALHKNTLYRNRMVSCGIWFTVGVLAIQLCTLVTQYTMGFGLTKDLLLFLVYTFLILWLEALLGLMIGSFSISLCHNVPEGIFTAALLTAAPYTIAQLLHTAALYMLNGYGSFSESYAFGLPPSIRDYGSLFNPVGCLGSVPILNADGTYGYTSISDLSALEKGGTLEMPSLFWAIPVILAVYCIVVYISGAAAFRKKLFENINARIPSARSIGVCTFTLMLILCTTIPSILTEGWSFAAFEAIVVCIVLAVLWILLAARKKAKALLTAVAVPVCVIGLCFAGFGIWNTQYQNNIPETDEIAYAYVTESGDSFISKSTDSDPMQTTDLFLGKDYLMISEEPLLGRFTSENDLKTVRNIQQTLIENSTQGDGSASVYYVLKNGKTIMRTYSGLGKETMEALDALYDTDAVCEEMIYLLTADSDEEIARFNSTYKTDFSELSPDIANSLFLPAADSATTSCSSPDMLEDYMRIYALCQTEGADMGWSDTEITDMSDIADEMSDWMQNTINSSEVMSANLKHTEVLTTEQITILKQAVASDIKANGHSYVLYTEEAPIGMLSFGTSTTEYTSLAATSPSDTCSICIYPSMKNTVDALREMGYGSILETEDEVQKIYAANVAQMSQLWLDLTGTSRRFTGCYSSLYDKTLLSQNSDISAESDFVPMDAEFDLGKVLEEEGIPYEVITGKEQMNTLMEHANILADSNGDSTVLLVVYSDYTMTAYNIDENDLQFLPGKTQ